VVLLDGEPLPQANIAFVGEDGGAFATASTDAQGRFTLRAARGLNKVSVAKFDTEGAEEWAATSDEEEEELLAGTPEEMAEGNANQPQPVIAQKYFNADTSGIQFDVQPGMGEVTIEVTKE
ncbi:MAG: carboxypeptidase regulatory-like domain-containing protein, partial [Planctomycetota bacterium]